MNKCLIIRKIAAFIAFSVSCWQPVMGQTQSGKEAVETLVALGFENVGWTEDRQERTYVLQNSAYRLNGVGIGKAVDVIQKMGLPSGKPCRIVVLDNNVPQISLYYYPVGGDSIPETKRTDWNVSYDLGNSWKQARKVKRKNSSLFKVDILVYPRLYYKNRIITQVYQACLEMNPTVEVSLWRGSKLTAQVKIPVYNDGYPYEMKNVRPGYLTLEQQVRLPYNIWVRGVVGVFDTRSYGGEISLFHPFKDERFSVEGKVGLVGIGYFDSMNSFLYNGENRVYWSAGGNFYWPKYNTQFRLLTEQYMRGEVGVKAEMIRHFRYCSIGFYAVKARNVKTNGGFKFAVALPPYKYKRRGYMPRISTSQTMGLSYNAGNETRYYLMPYSRSDQSIFNSNQFNPIFIKSEIAK